MSSKADPASAKGVVQIMKKLQDYIPLPNGPDGEPYVVPCHGDQLSCERMVDARFAMGDHTLPRHTLKGLEPWPGEFHNRCLHLQDTMNELFTGSSAAQRGTLYHIKNKFGHRSVKKHVMENVPHVYDLLDFSTDSIVCMAALEVTGAQDIGELTLPRTDALTYLEDISKDIVTLLWPDMDVAQITGFVNLEGHENDDDDDDDDDDNDDDEKLYCSCQSSIANMQYDVATMIECSARTNCLNGNWFHLQCIHMAAQDIPDGDWWCSEACRKYSIYCHCKQNVRRPRWIRCNNEGLCLQSPDGWFHFKCTGLSKMPRVAWYCSPSCKEMSSSPKGEPAKTEKPAFDHVREYTRAVAWQGLFHRI